MNSSISRNWLWWVVMVIIVIGLVGGITLGVVGIINLPKDRSDAPQRIQTTTQSLIVSQRVDLGPVAMYSFINSDTLLLINYRTTGMAKAVPPSWRLEKIHYYWHSYTHQLIIAAFDSGGQLVNVSGNGVGWYLLDHHLEQDQLFLASLNIPRSVIPVH